MLLVVSYTQTHNQQLPDYGRNKPSNYIIYQDANNIYVCSMSEYLTQQDLHWNYYKDLKYILETPDDNDIGYVLEVDFHFPLVLHAKFKEFPPAPETLTPDIEWLTPYQQEIGVKTEILNNEFFMGLIN